MSSNSILSGGLLVGTGVLGGYLCLLSRGLLTSDVVFELPNRFLLEAVLPDFFLPDVLVTAGWGAGEIDLPDWFLTNVVCPENMLTEVILDPDAWASQEIILPEQLLLEVHLEDEFE